MSVRTAERRRVPRAPATFPAILYDRRGRLLARGRTADISECGALITDRGSRGKPQTSQAVLEMTLPSTSRLPNKRTPTRTVRYVCRIVRAQRLGPLLSLGVEFIEKLA